MRKQTQALDKQEQLVMVERFKDFFPPTKETLMGITLIATMILSSFF